MADKNTYPRVSIVLPTYNRVMYIGEAIDSVLKQTYANWELLVVDDGSTDNTVELVSQIEDDRIRLLQTPKRLWATGTRNFGLNDASGELIAFIDSDDLWAPSKLQKQVNALQQYADAGFCVTGGYNFREPGQPAEYFYKKREGMRYDDLFLPFFKGDVSATTPSFMFRKQLLDAVGLFNDKKSFADVDFFIRIANATKGIILYEPLFYRRLHDSNISNRNWEKGFEEGIEIINSYKDALPPDIWKNALFKAYINGGEKYLKLKNRKKALANFFKAWQQKPFNMISYRKIMKAIIG